MGNVKWDILNKVEEVKKCDRFGHDSRQNRREDIQEKEEADNGRI